jgi:hypothetical protein
MRLMSVVAAFSLAGRGDQGTLRIGRRWAHLATMVERTKRVTVLNQLDGRDTRAVTASRSGEMTELLRHLRRSFTWDRGMELANYHGVTASREVAANCADPHNQWRYDTNEKIDRLLRQPLSKGVSMAELTQSDLDLVAVEVNARPRKTLDFDRPAARLEALPRRPTTSTAANFGNSILHLKMPHAMIFRSEEASSLAAKIAFRTPLCRYVNGMREAWGRGRPRNQALFGRAVTRNGSYFYRVARSA